MRKNIQIILSKFYIYFVSSTIGSIILDAYEAIKYKFASEEEKERIDKQRHLEEKNSTIYNSIFKLLELSDAIVNKDSSKISLLKNKILWDSIINDIEPNINNILKIEDEETLIKKLCDISISLLDAI